jgi:hypothetical protein
MDWEALDEDISVAGLLPTVQARGLNAHGLATRPAPLSSAAE